MSPLSILLLGDVDRAEFRDARPCLERWGTVHAQTDVATAAAVLAEGELAPDVIVIAQAFPGQFSHPTVECLRRLAPLAPVVGLLGSWCEGEMRSGRPWPAAVRTYWHQWPARGNRQLRRLTHGERCAWTLPSTATEEERLLVECSRHTPCAACCVGVAVELPPQRAGPLSGGRQTPCACYIEQRGLILIHAQSREMAQWLSAACRSRGFATVWQQMGTVARVEGARAAIFDAATMWHGRPRLCEPWGTVGVGTAEGGCATGRSEECHELQHLAAALQPAPVIALLAYPRVEDHRRALAAGAVAVLSKPLAVEDLFWELERVGGEGERGERRGEREIRSGQS